MPTSCYLKFSNRFYQCMWEILISLAGGLSFQQNANLISIFKKMVMVLFDIFSNLSPLVLK